MATTFAEAADRAFAFLINNGFRRTQTLDQRIRYSDSKVFVDVVWPRMEYVVDAAVGRTVAGRESPPTEALPLYVLLRAVGVPDNIASEPARVESDEQLGQALTEVARRVERWATPFLQGDARAFSQAMTTMQQISREREEAAAARRNSPG